MWVRTRWGWLLIWGTVACAEAPTDSGGSASICTTIIEVDADWVSVGDGEVAYSPCFVCDGENVCTTDGCCPPGWVFLAPGEDRSTVLCEME